jgi:hypothetical protein
MEGQLSKFYQGAGNNDFSDGGRSPPHLAQGIKIRLNDLRARGFGEKIQELLPRCEMN